MIKIEHGVGAEQVPSIGMSYRCTMLCYFNLATAEIHQVFSGGRAEPDFCVH
jgi:hypothetical protein